MAGTTAKIKLILDDGLGSPVTIAETPAHNIDDDDIQNGEVNFDISTVLAGFARVHATGYFSNIIQPANTGVTANLVNNSFYNMQVSTAILKLEVVFSVGDTSNATLLTCRLEGMPVTQSI